MTAAANSNPHVFKEDTITLRKKTIKVKNGFLPQVELKFFPENPRIYSIVWKTPDAEPTQQEIFEALSKAEHVRETLVPSIRSNGGLIEPVLVRNNVVLEGNSRLAAYRILAQKDPSTWEFIRVRVLPDSISDSEVFSLLGEYHIVGKKDWLPYEQAGYLFRRFNTHGIDENQLHKEVGLSKTKITHLIRVYGFMVEMDDRNPDRWSYYDELLKGRKYNQARKLYPDFDKKIAEMIQEESIVKAVDVRDTLPMIVKAGGNTLKKMMTGKLSFEEAKTDAISRGAGNSNCSKMTDFRKWLSHENIETELTNASEEEKKILKYELGAIGKRVKQLNDKFNS